MTTRRTSARAPALIAASALALGLGLAPGLSVAQTIQGGTSGGLSGPGVGASTYGSGSTDGTSIGVTGGGDAYAGDGTATTRSDAKLNERRAMQRSVATARDEDERARSRTHTVVRQGEVVRSRTTSSYKARGEKPERETVVTVVKPDGAAPR
ncbi:MAG TPA: hypothetical protein VM471_08685 [Phenylobacterium sp.]|nr:hypothetical protein [Phenylobacterium sp.]